MTARELNELALDAYEISRQQFIDFRNAIVGREVKIASDYNGQPHGRSRPRLLGKTFIVENAHLDVRSGWSLKLRGERLYIALDEVFIQESATGAKA